MRTATPPLDPGSAGDHMRIVIGWDDLGAGMLKRVFWEAEAVYCGSGTSCTTLQLEGRCIRIAPPAHKRGLLVTGRKTSPSSGSLGRAQVRTMLRPPE